MLAETEADTTEAWYVKYINMNARLLDFVNETMF